MIHLTPQERKVLLFVSFLFALSFILSFYKKTTGNNTCCFIDFYSNRAKPVLLDINKATKEELVALPAIGEKTAAAILEYRTTRQGFKNLDELKNIKGISDDKLTLLKKYLKLPTTEK